MTTCNTCMKYHTIVYNDRSHLGSIQCNILQKLRSSLAGHASLMVAAAYPRHGCPSCWQIIHGCALPSRDLDGRPGVRYAAKLESNLSVGFQTLAYLASSSCTRTNLDGMRNHTHISGHPLLLKTPFFAKRHPWRTSSGSCNR